VPVPTGADETGNCVVSVGGVASNGVAFTGPLGRAASRLVQHTSKDAGINQFLHPGIPLHNNTAGELHSSHHPGREIGQALNVSDSHSNTYRQAVLLNMTMDGENGRHLLPPRTIAGGANTVTVSDNLSAGTLALLHHGILRRGAHQFFRHAVVAEGSGTSPSTPNAPTSWGGDLLPPATRFVTVKSRHFSRRVPVTESKILFPPSRTPR